MMWMRIYKKYKENIKNNNNNRDVSVNKINFKNKIELKK